MDSEHRLVILLGREAISQTLPPALLYVAYSNPKKRRHQEGFC
jgi:hypothetical protein